MPHCKAIRSSEAHATIDLVVEIILRRLKTLACFKSLASDAPDISVRIPSFDFALRMVLFDDNTVLCDVIHHELHVLPMYLNLYDKDIDNLVSLICSLDEAEC